MDPTTIVEVQNVALPDESFVVRVDVADGKQYWLSSSRVLEVQSAGGIQDLVSYDQIGSVSWMFSDLRDRIARAPHEMTAMKLAYFDRVVLRTGEREIMLDGLEQAYVPILSFFEWMLRSRGR